MTTGHAADTLDLPGWVHAYSGKVRDLYMPEGASSLAESDRVLMVASDRVSAFDHVLEPGIPGKGALLTQLSRWWFAQLPIANHLDPQGVVPDAVADRAVVARRLRMHPVECVVRGYLVGSGWAEYRERGTVCGIALPAGLTNGDRLPEPIYTPAWKAPYGEHDENITFERSVELVGASVAEALRDASLAIFTRASAVAESRGVILADTKFEFGDDPETGELTLADEVLTSDSSRYWDATLYAAGGPDRLASFDKQIVRDWLAANWDGSGVSPRLPVEIVERTAARYRELIDRLTA
ncbi:phosphoribosylaminoimidazole-succinocarboxamide synthase [Microcella alkaliphila]|uniref:Phosphoribosylaminoimidazole-succinocarboxamide synthase n=1 Tax=Microcella alkaliphila TaxID=279828 RepID=A0A4Q7TMU0_9MICO|nr:phosphoribosylaminoimidazolesuccinocarboxamide synthase [Microcella alkaliphila]RZT60888.1 phosphoribosylaminoimidazole-succinocarboxamide synthase [Microcella alkaliphila]